MGMTLTEKILARASGNQQVRPGQIVTAKIDLAITQDALGPITFKQFRELKIPVWDKEKVWPVIDHACLHGTVKDALVIEQTAQFVQDFDLPNYGNMKGVSHQLVVESGKFGPGMVGVGTDSHTCTYGALGAFSTGIGSTEMVSVFAEGELWFKVPETIKVNVHGNLPEKVMSKDIMLKLLSIIGPEGATYKALEFCGETIEKLSMESRFTLCNMAVESGAKNGIIKADKITIDYLKAAGADINIFTFFESDQDAEYEKVIDIDVSNLTPMVAKPFLPSNAVPVQEVAGRKLTQVIIGACTNGRLEDIKTASDILQGKKVPRDLRVFIVPASMKVYRQAADEGYLSKLAEAGCIIVNPGCGGCGIQMPMLKGQVCLGTHNRNFKGRMGDNEALVYLASPATAAASALSGVIADPSKL